MKKTLFGSLGESIKGNAVLIVLSVCVLAAGVLSYYTVSDINNKLKNQQVKPPAQNQVIPEQEDAQKVQNKGENVPLKPTATPTTDAPAAAKPSPAPPVPDKAPTSEGFIKPVAGEVYNAFSRDELVYNKSMDDWRTHNGVDIKASKDSAVKAGAAGIVSAVYTDGMLGMVVEVKTDDYVARYCGLNSTVPVKKGDRVEQGQPLGTVGEVTLEIAEEAHLHLEIVKNGNTIDPLEIMK
ncbi:MAG: M23 family metallopeptidase [Oscillospiraceae bacterium]